MTNLCSQNYHKPIHKHYCSPQWGASDYGNLRTHYTLPTCVSVTTAMRSNFAVHHEYHQDKGSHGEHQDKEQHQIAEARLPCCQRSAVSTEPRVIWAFCDLSDSLFQNGASRFIQLIYLRSRGHWTSHGFINIVRLLSWRIRFRCNWCQIFVLILHWIFFTRNAVVICVVHINVSSRRVGWGLRRRGSCTVQTSLSIWDFQWIEADWDTPCPICGWRVKLNRVI